MEKPKPTQNHEQKQETPEDYVVATFPVDIDPDNARRPLTVIRSGQDGESVKYDRGWNPIGISVVCDTDSEKGIGPIKLLMEAYQLVGTDIKTEFVLLEDIQDLNEDYIKYLCEKTTKEMIEEGKRAAEQIWRQKHSDSMRIESLAPGVGSDSGAETSLGVETPSNDLVEDNTSDHEKSLVDEVSPAMGRVAVEAAGVEKPIYTNKVKTNEPVREPVETDKTGVGSPALKMTKEVLASIGAIKVNDSVGLPAIESAKKPAEIDKVGANPADLVATEPAKKPVEADKASAAPADLPAAKSVENSVVEKSMETNEANTDILPEDFKSVINNFEKYTGGDNGEFSAETKPIARELNELKWRIQRNPEAIKELATEELIRRASSRIRELEVSRAKSANEFKNNIDSLLKGLKSKIENDDELKRLVELTDHVDQMGVDNKVLGDLTNVLLGKLTIIRSIIDNSRNDRWGIIAYRDRFVRVIEEIIGSDDYRDIDRKFSGDLGPVYRRRQSILDAIEGIRKAGYR